MSHTSSKSITPWSTSDLYRLLLSLHVSNALYPHFTSLLPSHPPSSIRTLLLNLTLPTHPKANTWPTAKLARHILTLHNGNPYTPSPHPPCTRRGRVTLRVTPFFPTDAAAVTQQNHNPNVEVILRGARPVWDVVVHFFHKWGLPVRLRQAQQEIRDLTMPVFYLVAPDAPVASVVTLQFEVLRLQLDVATMVNLLKGRQRQAVRASVGRGKRVCAPPTPQKAGVKRRKKMRADDVCSAERQRLATRAAQAALAALNSVDRTNATGDNLALKEQRGANIDFSSFASLGGDMLEGEELENVEIEAVSVSPGKSLGRGLKVESGGLTSSITSPLLLEKETNGKLTGSVGADVPSSTPCADKIKRKGVAGECMDSFLSPTRRGTEAMPDSLFDTPPQTRNDKELSELRKTEARERGNAVDVKAVESEGGSLKKAAVIDYELARRTLQLDDIGEELSLEDDEESEGEKAVMKRLQYNLEKLDSGEKVGAAESHRGDGGESVQVQGFSCSALIPDAFLKSGSVLDIGALGKLPDSILAIGKAEGGSGIKTEISNVDNASDGAEFYREDEWERDLRRLARVEEGRSLSLSGIFRNV